MYVSVVAKPAAPRALGDEAGLRRRALSPGMSLVVAPKAPHVVVAVLVGTIPVALAAAVVPTAAPLAVHGRCWLLQCTAV